MSKSSHTEPTNELPSLDEMHLPPRRVIHSSDNTKGSRIFQSSLVLLLVLLTIGIIIWYQWYET
ncbi:MAG: hypothetical protein K0Q59_561 [Paenibacillus sp.]|jgi:hypothetical protein|nr:hypothetical protein [Paenibacillus sp.]